MGALKKQEEGNLKASNIASLKISLKCAIKETILSLNMSLAISMCLQSIKVTCFGKTTLDLSTLYFTVLADTRA